MGKRKRKLSLQALRILHYLFQNPTKEVCGADMIKELDIASGSLYPILLRLEKNEFVESEWETKDPSTLGRPRRRLYTITGTGLKAAQKAVAEFNQVAPQPGLVYER
ncbi:MAG: helix-turn-helix transcriptional regulator [Cyanobacteria bacterium P01_F01_bin.3]